MKPFADALVSKPVSVVHRRLRAATDSIQRAHIRRGRPSLATRLATRLINAVHGALGSR
jgi:hypothetical protein